MAKNKSDTRTSVDILRDLRAIERSKNTVQLSMDIMRELQTTDSIKRRRDIVEVIGEKTEIVLRNVVTEIFHMGNKWRWNWDYQRGVNPEPEFDFEYNIELNDLIDDEWYLTFRIIFENDDLNYSSMRHVGRLEDMWFFDRNGEGLSVNEGHIPVRWLWEDYQRELIEGIQKFKDNEDK